MEQPKQESKIVDEQTVYKRYIEVRDRVVSFDPELTISYDLVGHSHPFVVVSVYSKIDKKFKLIKEYCQGTNTMLYNFACGGYEPKKHKTILDTAEAEVNEECQVKGGKFIDLIAYFEGDKEGLNELKWSFNRFFPFLNLDPTVDEQPKLRDLEERDMKVLEMNIEEMENIICKGELMLPAVQTFMMTKRYLLENNLL